MEESAEHHRRDATEDDLDWIAEREVEIFGPAAWSRTLIDHEFHRDLGRRFRIAEVGDERVGYAVFGFESDVFTLLNLAVLPEWRGRGIARAFLDDFLDDARRLRVREVWLEVAVDNIAAIRLYRGLGFEEVRRRKRYYQPGDVDAFVMRRWLGPGPKPGVE
jgi:ribosomal-protein-alanine N-acetyltransferase